MKYITLSILCLTLFSCTTNSTDQTNLNKPNSKKDSLASANWITYHDTVNMGFIMTFRYPDSLIVCPIENYRCVGKKIKEPKDGITNTCKWAVILQDTGNYSIDSCISIEKSLFKELDSETRDTVIVDNLKAIRVTLISKIKNDRYSYNQTVYLKKYSCLFQITNEYMADKGFETFYNSLTITKNKMPSH